VKKRKSFFPQPVRPCTDFHQARAGDSVPFCQRVRGSPTRLDHRSSSLLIQTNAEMFEWLFARHSCSLAKYGSTSEVEPLLDPAQRWPFRLPFDHFSLDQSKASASKA